MDPYYHNHHQWRSFPPPHSAAPTICPTCSHSHFPFCPPLPPPLPPPPPYNQNPINKFPDYPQYDPYHHPPPPAPYSYHHHQPDFHPNPRPAACNGYITNAGRTHKRPRVDENLPVMMFSSDNERRLKLIRDHGSAADCHHWGPAGPGDNTNCSGNNNMYSPFQSNSNNDPNGSPGFRGYFPPPTLPPPPRSYENGAFLGQPPPPPLPASPPPPPPPPLHSPPKASFSLFPVPVSSSGSNPYLHSNPGSGGSVSEEWGGSTRQYRGEAQAFVHKQLSPDKPAMVDASRLFKQPYRTMRPNRLVIILRGLPGSGKSYLAKMIRDLEVENGSEAPRIHSMDDYFMTEVEKVEDCDTSKSASTARGKKQTVKKVMEYCYEPEMEEAYRESMLKAFKKTLEEGIFTLVIVDDRNLRVADFAQFWAIAKRSGYEVYVSEAVYKDPVGCAARNVHGFTLDEIQRMANQWEEAPSLYMQLDNKSLFHGDDLKESGIQEVDMDTEDGDVDDDSPGLHEKRSERALITSLEDEEPHDSSEDGNRWGAEEDHPHGVKELGKSKWSNNLDEDDTESSKAVKGNLNALSGLVQAYGKRRKSVHWSDQAGYSGFSISTVLKRSMPSLVIGPGAGYNLKSNPLHAEESSMGKSVGRSRNQTVFQERLRAEHESFKAVFDKRRQRIGGLALEEE